MMILQYYLQELLPMLRHSTCNCHYLYNIPAMKYIQKNNGKEKSMNFTSKPFGFLSSILGDTVAE